MSSFYQLKINTDESNYEKVNQILNVTATSTSFGWEYSLNENDSLFNDAISYLLSIIESKMEGLQSIGISGKDITLWYLYEYEQQCNMEFAQIELKQMGDLGITFCISCWEKA